MPFDNAKEDIETGVLIFIVEAGLYEFCVDWMRMWGVGDFISVILNKVDFEILLWFWMELLFNPRGW